MATKMVVMLSEDIKSPQKRFRNFFNHLKKVSPSTLNYRKKGKKWNIRIFDLYFIQFFHHCSPELQKIWRSLGINVELWMCRGRGRSQWDVEDQTTIFYKRRESYYSERRHRERVVDRYWRNASAVHEK